MAYTRTYDQARHPRLAKALARDGYIDVDIARLMGISKKTLNVWKKKYPEFAEALKTGKLEVDLQVEDGLLKRALGYDYDEVEIITGTDGDITKPSRIKKVKKHVPPDVTAQIFWLKNRQPERWRDKPDVALSVQVTNNNECSGIIQEIVADNEVAQRIRENFRRRVRTGFSEG